MHVIIQAVTLPFGATAQGEEAYGKHHVNGLVRQKNGGNKEQRKTEKQRKKWKRKITLQ